MHRAVVHIARAEGTRVTGEWCTHAADHAEARAYAAEARRTHLWQRVVGECADWTASCMESTHFYKKCRTRVNLATQVVPLVTIGENRG